MPNLESLLESITFKVSAAELGTGFAVSPNLIATAYHLLRPNRESLFAESLDDHSYLFNALEIQIQQNGESFEIVEVNDSLKHLDLLLLRTSKSIEPYSFLSRDIVSDDELLCCGYPEGNCSMTYYKYNGWVDVGDVRCVNIKDGVVKGGQSGAPLLDTRTGAVCGMILKSEDQRMPTGGYALPVSQIPLADGSVVQPRSQSHKTYQLWNSAASMISTFDFSNNPIYRKLFPFDDIDFEDVLVEPSYSRLRFDKNLNSTKQKTAGFLIDAQDILNHSRCLFIFGGYGSGKSFLSKALLSELFHQEHDIVFVSARELNSRMTELTTYFQKRRQSDVSCAVVIDGFDEQNLLGQGNPEIGQLILTQLLPMLHYSNVKLIVNSRIIPSQSGNAYLELLGAISSKIDKDGFELLEVDYFAKDQIGKWLDCYSNEQAKLGNEYRLYYSDLPSKTNSNLSHACKNPLFLYMYTKRYYENPDDPLDIFSLYESFVESTVKGKFDHEGENLYSMSIEEIAPIYRQFLRTLATKIAIVQPELHFDAETIESWKLDENEHVYPVHPDSIQEIINEASQQLLTSDQLNTINPKKLQANILSCYFLSQSDNGWHFRDNNILFFLIADLFAVDFMKASEIAPESQASVGHFFPNLANLKEIPLHPVSVRIFLLHLKQLDDDRKSSLQQKLLEIMKGHRQILNPQVDLRLNLLVTLAFINTYESSYKEIPGFAVHLRQIVLALEQRDELGRDIFRSFFRDVDICDLEVSNVELEGFNFSNSRLKNVRFDQCNLNNARFENCNIQNTEFRHCKIRDPRFTGVNCEARFVDCKNLVLHIHNHSGLSLSFAETQINELQIMSSRRSAANQIDIQISNKCRIQNVILDCQYVRNLSIANKTEYYKLKVPGSDIVFDIDESCELLSGNRWERGSKTKLFDNRSGEIIDGIQ